MINNIELFDFFTILGRINPTVIGHLQKGTSEKDISKIIRDMTSTHSYLPGKLKQITEYIGFADGEIILDNWPIMTLKKWNNIYDLLKNKVHTGNPLFEKYWRLTHILAFQLWIPLSKEIEFEVRELLKYFGVSAETIDNIIASSYSEDQVIRIKAVEDVRNQLRYQDASKNTNNHTNDIDQSLNFLLQEYTDKGLKNKYYRDMIQTINEIRICYNNSCYIAVLSLAGKVLEVCLKNVLINSNIDFDKNWMIGALIKKIRESNPETYIYDALKNIVNVINESRITAVHAKEDVPVPSENQTKMVIYAMIDIFNRTVLLERADSNDNGKSIFP